jgi:hypothetical protein
MRSCVRERGQWLMWTSSWRFVGRAGIGASVDDPSLDWQ